MKKNNSQPFNPFKDLVLDQYEKEIENGIKNTNSLTPPTKNRISELKTMAQNTTESIKKNKNINLRVTESTYQNLKAKASKLGIPYQTLASSILHQFANH